MVIGTSSEDGQRRIVIGGSAIFGESSETKAWKTTKVTAKWAIRTPNYVLLFSYYVLLLPIERFKLYFNVTYREGKYIIIIIIMSLCYMVTTGQRGELNTLSESKTLLNCMICIKNQKLTYKQKCPVYFSSREMCVVCYQDTLQNGRKTKVV